jgi:hypothetical protein
MSYARVVHTWNPSYSGGRGQEDRSSQPAQANSSQDPISKIPNTEKKVGGGAGGVAQGVGPEFKPQYSPSPQKKICHKYLRFGRLHMVKLWSVFSFFVFSIL